MYYNPGYNLDDEKKKMSLPPKECGYQIRYPYQVMPINMKDLVEANEFRKIEKAKYKEVSLLKQRNS